MLHSSIKEDTKDMGTEMSRMEGETKAADPFQAEQERGPLGVSYLNLIAVPFTVVQVKEYTL